MGVYDFQRDRYKFEKQAQYYLSLLKYTDDHTGATKYIDEKCSPKECYIISTGVINAIWQSWNNLWRNYWFLFINGGVLGNGRDINPMAVDLPAIPASPKQDEMLYNFLRPTFPNLYQRRFPQKKVPSYNEPTWGAMNLLSTITTYYSNEYTISGVSTAAQSTTNLLGALNLIGTQVDHLQYVRNAAVHLTKDSVIHIKTVVATQYSIRKNLQYPTDVLFARCIPSGKTAIDSWIDDLASILSLI